MLLRKLGLPKAMENFFLPTGGGLSVITCLLYTSDAADDLLCVDLGGRRLIKTQTPSIQ